MNKIIHLKDMHFFFRTSFLNFYSLFYLSLEDLLQIKPLRLLLGILALFLESIFFVDCSSTIYFKRVETLLASSTALTATRRL